MRHSFGTLTLFLFALALPAAVAEETDGGWRTILDPKALDEKAWTFYGEGSFVQEDGALKTVCSDKGLGLLVYTKEKLGDCQIRVVFRSDDARDNAGVYVRIDPDDGGKLKLKPDPKTEGGPWWAVHHGYEVQICDAGDAYHRTGAIYSLAPSTVAPSKKPTEWKTMVITLRGDLVLVSVDGKQVTRFDPAGKDVPPQKEWYEPKREPKRPRAGYIGLQTHDPGDVVYFKEVSVRPLPKP